ncbi:uncharacterized protein C2orf81 homolog isoform X2 [Gadus morhua]|nr:uncharacterized protein C2orf81 homolog isoform X2 [Gadus morhua]XP_030214178.1 uncharacterized protein C2orf81 homolog isoform X2 [Gadus morhua]XP_030214179.1 uncharacterized protein C2orf81 homolog isoform X2 [Gadus morhua]XP_030214180.1 uncharacterized protein C2orf81 homolog isoform X2 [Gadus morhua]
MSRSASKSRADTRGPKAPVQAASPQSNDPPVEEDVVPGHLTQTQWEDLLKLEETGENVEEIVEDLMGNVMEKCLKSHIHKQLVAFTVCWAKDFLVEAMELALLYRDPGDGPEEAFSTAEDSQPVPSPIDSWAQGCVPVVSISSPPPPPLPPHATPHKAAGLDKKEPGSPRPPCPEAQLNSSRVQHEKHRERSGPADHSPHRIATPTPPGKSDRKKKMKILLNTAAKESIQSSTQSLSRLVTQGEQEEDRKRRVCLSTDGFDSLPASEGKQPVSKRHHVLQPLPLVSPQYEILDTLLPKRQTIHGLPLSGHKYTKQRAASTSMKLKPLPNYTDHKAKLQQRPNAQPRTDSWLEPRHHSTPVDESGIIRFSGSLRLDTMNLLPGVSLNESQGLQNSPLNTGTQVCLDNMAELRPIRRYPALPSLTTEQRSTGVPAQAMPLK